ncbi:MAG: hypothetical protein K2M97_08030 [Muribaculaceae bacterium]|nr:hypothetical protein [Muribaculaceae bacterium]
MAVTLLLAATSFSCAREVIDDRVYGYVNIPFTTVNEWINFGVGGAGMSRRFVPELHEPAGYQWLVGSAAGFGGVLLTRTLFDDIWVFDAACPYERNPKIRVAMDAATNTAKCPKCGSTYDVLQTSGLGPGHAISGPAYSLNYSLTPYRIEFGAANRYAILRN